MIDSDLIKLYAKKAAQKMPTKTVPKPSGCQLNDIYKVGPTSYK